MSRTKLTTAPNMTVTDADACMQAIAELECEQLRVAVRHDRKINRVKEECEQALAPLAEQLEAEQAKLAQFIDTHPAAFIRPRARKTNFGSYGKRSTPPKLQITDESAVVAWADGHGYTDVVIRQARLSKPAILKRAKAGEHVPSVKVTSAEETFCKTAPSLLKAVREGVE